MATGVDAKLLKSTKFPPEFSQKVDMEKVNLEVMKKWIAGKISEILGNEDDVVIELCFNLIEGSRYPDIKKLQIQLTGFLDKDTASFCKELWKLCLSAQSNPQGVPKELLEAKKLELIQEKISTEALRESRIHMFLLDVVEDAMIAGDRLRLHPALLLSLDLSPAPAPHLDDVAVLLPHVEDLAHQIDVDIHIEDVGLEAEGGVSIVLHVGEALLPRALDLDLRGPPIAEDQHLLPPAHLLHHGLENLVVIPARCLGLLLFQGQGVGHQEEDRHAVETGQHLRRLQQQMKTWLTRLLAHPKYHSATSPQKSFQKFQSWRKNKEASSFYPTL
ncbi:PWI domain-containing protein [Mollisia scopiformis]|uniref:PWI domain-containing protein n=1 Tax=Mollisia scopiformis TaxID=149040 RepID=A0A194XRN3_MOLSC|nr:PWI domain-containing protein [Mollisia scopiformis]KUJ22853.1 PWI domain-containing protein [Mollisia scopiformis]